MITEERLAEIEALVAPVLGAHELTLVDLEWRRAGRRWILRFSIDRAGAPQTGRRLSVDDCTRFSREVGDLLDVSDLILGSYDLEVSSPGVDRELTKERELRWAVGKAVHCWLREPHHGRLEFVGRLRAVTDDALVLEQAGGPVELARSCVSKARLEFSFPRRP